MGNLKENINSSIALKKAFLTIENIHLIEDVISICVQTLKRGNAIIFCGNGGSAADAIHLSTELSGRYYLNRPALKSFTLGTNIASSTAISNDYGFDHLFERELEALGTAGDLLFAISTSGNSQNIINAVERAKKMDIKTIGLTGRGKNKLQEMCDFIISIPSDDTPRIQEMHTIIGHTICENIELQLFKK